MVHAWIQEFCHGGVGGGNGQINFLLVLSLFQSLQRGSNIFLPIFSKGGVLMLISIETHRTWDFSGGGGGGGNGQKTFF